MVNSLAENLPVESTLEEKWTEDMKRIDKWKKNGLITKDQILLRWTNRILHVVDELELLRRYRKHWDNFCLDNNRPSSPQTRTLCRRHADLNHQGWKPESLTTFFGCNLSNYTKPMVQAERIIWRSISYFASWPFPPENRHELDFESLVRATTILISGGPYNRGFGIGICNKLKSVGVRGTDQNWRKALFRSFAVPVRGFEVAQNDGSIEVEEDDGEAGGESEVDSDEDTEDDMEIDDDKEAEDDVGDDEFESILAVLAITQPNAEPGSMEPEVQREAFRALLDDLPHTDYRLCDLRIPYAEFLVLIKLMIFWLSQGPELFARELGRSKHQVDTVVTSILSAFIHHPHSSRDSVTWESFDSVLSSALPNFFVGLKRLFLSFHLPQVRPPRSVDPWIGISKILSHALACQLSFFLPGHVNLDHLIPLYNSEATIYSLLVTVNSFLEHGMTKFGPRLISQASLILLSGPEVDAENPHSIVLGAFLPAWRNLYGPFKEAWIFQLRPVHRVFPVDYIAGLGSTANMYGNPPVDELGGLTIGTAVRGWRASYPDQPRPENAVADDEVDEKTLLMLAPRLSLSDDQDTATFVYHSDDHKDSDSEIHLQVRVKWLEVWDFDLNCALARIMRVKDKEEALAWRKRNPLGMIRC